MITYNTQQLDAIQRAIKWFFTDSYKNNLFVIGGLAGCGKSTVVKVIIRMLGLSNDDVIFATLTSKASLVLRLKGNPSNTIHKTFYSVYKKGKTFKFSLKKHISNNIRLIVIDEVSMVNLNMINDILSFNVPVIALGDFGQLSPIFGGNIFDIRKPDVFLTMVMRQSDESGILDLATKARAGEPIPLGQYKASSVTTLEKIWDNISNYDLVLCYSNKTRRLYNSVIRKQKGYTNIYPQKGEKVLCLVNNYNYEIEYDDIPIYLNNGLMGYVQNDCDIINETGELETCELTFIPEFINDIDESHKFKIKCFKEVFDQYNIDISKEPFIEQMINEEVDEDILGEIGMIDFGYCLTVHKSQGSEANNVLVLNDFKGSSNNYNKWLYTAITRAKKSVTIVDLH